MADIRALGRMMIPDLLGRGLGANQIINEIRTVLGGGWRRATMLSDIREFSGFLRQQKPFESLRESTRIPKNYMTDIPLKQSYKYMAKGIAYKYNSVTGASTSEYISMYTDSVEDKDGLTDLYAQTTEQREEYEDIVHLDVQWIGVFHNENWAY